jgi:hypothetical protein
MTRFFVGERVLVIKKLSTPQVTIQYGPYIVLERLADQLYKVGLDGVTDQTKTFIATESEMFRYNGTRVGY